MKIWTNEEMENNKNINKLYSKASTNLFRYLRFQGTAGKLFVPRLKVLQQSI